MSKSHVQCGWDRTRYISNETNANCNEIKWFMECNRVTSLKTKESRQQRQSEKKQGEIEEICRRITVWNKLNKTGKINKWKILGLFCFVSIFLSLQEESSKKQAHKKNSIQNWITSQIKNVVTSSSSAIWVLVWGKLYLISAMLNIEMACHIFQS